MKAQKSKWLYLKIGLYGVLLYSIVSIMQYVKSPTFSSNIDVLIGSPSQSRYLDWCPKSVQIISIIPSLQTVRDLKQIQELCHLPYSSYNSDEVANIQWSMFMKAMNGHGEELFVETDPSRNFIKHGSLIYKVNSLKNKMKSLGLAEE